MPPMRMRQFLLPTEVPATVDFESLDTHSIYVDCNNVRIERCQNWEKERYQSKRKRSNIYYIDSLFHTFEL